MSGSTAWPVPPEVEEIIPAGRRRAWGKLSHEERFRRQRRDLLAAAARLAVSRGYEGTRVADIVAEAGLSKSTFYEHFQSKEECFVELYQRTSAAMLRTGIAAAESSLERGPYEAILAVIKALTGYVSQNPRLAEVIRVEVGAAQPAIAIERAENRRRIADLFRVLARRLGSPLAEDDLRLSVRVVVEGVTTVLPELRDKEATFEHRLQAIARLGCRALGFDHPEPSGS